MEGGVGVGAMGACVGAGDGVESGTCVGAGDAVESGACVGAGDAVVSGTCVGAGDAVEPGVVVGAGNWDSSVYRLPPKGHLLYRHRGPVEQRK